MELFWSVFSHIRIKYGEILVSLRIRSECGKIRTTITSNTDNFYAVFFVFFQYRVHLIIGFLSFVKTLQKQRSRGGLGKRCSPVNLLHIFSTPFCKSTSRGLLLTLLLGRIITLNINEANGKTSL